MDCMSLTPSWPPTPPRRWLLPLQPGGGVEKGQELEARDPGSSPASRLALGHVTSPLPCKMKMIVLASENCEG